MSTSKRPKNALKHGLFSSEVIVLPWENEQEFNELLQALREEYYPDGISEEAAVFEMARQYWTRRRLTIGTRLAFHGQPDAEALAAAGAVGGWQGVAKYLNTGGAGDRVLDSFRKLAKLQAAATMKVSEEINRTIGDKSQPMDAVVLEKQALLLKEINDVTKTAVVPLLQLMENYDVEQKIAERAYRPDLMEKEMKLLAEIDKRIAKALDNLMRGKEYKKYYARLAIEEQSTKVVSLPAKPNRKSEKE